MNIILNKMLKQILHYLFSILSLVAVCFLWKYNIILFLVLLAISFLLLFIQKEKSEIWLFIACGFYGALAEIIAIYFGSWTYNSADFLGVPIWLPVLWGIAALFMKRLHEHIKFELNTTKNTMIKNNQK